MDKASYETQLFKRIFASLEKHRFQTCVVSVLLTGSFGRGEATYRYTQDGVVLESDVEIGLLYKGFRNKKIAHRLVDQVSAEFTEDLNLMVFPERRIRKRHNYNHTLFTPRYKTLFAFDLFNGSKTLWGREYLQHGAVTLPEVDLYEAKRIVANRIGELIFQSGGKDPIWQAKLLLAIGSAYLLCEGLYTSSYHGQHDRLLSKAAAVTAVFDEGFPEDYEKAFAYLREGADSFQIAEQALQRYVGAMDTYLKQKGITTPKTNCFSRRLKYSVKYLKCGMPKGFFRMEDKILQDLIQEFSAGNTAVIKTAALWHQVLY